MNSLERLIYMANQIARNMGTMGTEHTAAAVADHIASFWDPRMKAMIFDHLGAGGEGLDPVARVALTQLRDQGPPPHQTRATEFNAADESGHADAG